MTGQHLADGRSMADQAAAAPQKVTGALPRTPALPQRWGVVYQVIASPGQAEPYARTPGQC
jgi:hypothetical protein